MDKKYLVYQHINKINNKMYIGITSNSPEKRWGKMEVTTQRAQSFTRQSINMDGIILNILY